MGHISIFPGVSEANTSEYFSLMAPSPLFLPAVDVGEYQYESRFSLREVKGMPAYSDTIIESTTTS